MQKMFKDNIIRIWKAKGLILEGVANSIFKKEDVEQIAHQRMQICIKCACYDVQGTGCAMPFTQPCCNNNMGGCGCSLSLKTRALSSSCPLDFWHAELTKEEEDKILKNGGMERAILRK